MDTPIPTMARRFRDLIARRAMVLPGAANALTALQIERAGFEALYISGAGLAAVRGLPDIGLLSMAEVVGDAGTIARAVGIPALVDADTGYGGPLSVMRAVREFERAGLAGLHIEDQQDPKKCGHLSGKRLIPATDMARKIAAAAEARRDLDFLIVARTDARAVEGLDEAVERGETYVRAGADALFPEALESPEEFRTFAEGIAKQGLTVPLIANMTEFGKTPYLTRREFEELGYRIVLFPLTALRAATKAAEAALSELRTLGTQREFLGRMDTREHLYDLLRYADYEQRDRELSERYGDEGGRDAPV